MIRAVFFDFYSVWGPDKLAYYLAYAQLLGPEIYKELYDASEKYYQGDLSLDDMTGTFRYKLGAKDISQDTFKLSAASISPEITKFMQELHGHFVKVGVLANLGKHEYEVLREYNQTSQTMEAVASPYTLDLKKPLLDAEVFNAAFAAIGETADNCLVVSGNPSYLAFAKLLGVQTIQFEGLIPLKEKLNHALSQDLPQISPN